MTFRLFLISLCWCILVPLLRGAGPVPLPAAHAHNDYEHARPLLDALDHGFLSVEVDIHLVDGQLLVAHDVDDVKPERTLENLYLQPLAARVKANGGWVYAEGRTLTLLIDIKGPAEETWRALLPRLEAYRPMLTESAKGNVTRRAVTVLLSGNRPFITLERASARLAFLDGRLSDLEANPPVDLVPLISANAADVFPWRGRGPVPAKDRKRLREIADQAHAQGRQLRLWATPDLPVVWDFLRSGGVDVIGADHLGLLRDYLRKAEQSSAADQKIKR